MSVVNLSPAAARLLGPARAELGTHSEEGPLVLAVTTVTELSETLALRPPALLLLVQPDDPLPDQLEGLRIPFDVAWLPARPGELQLRSQKLHRASNLALVGRIASSAAREMGNALSYTCTNIEYIHRAVTTGGERDPEIPMVAEEAQLGIRQALETCRALLQMSAAPGSEPE